MNAFLKNIFIFKSLLLLMVLLTSGKPKEFRFLSETDIIQSSWPATVNFRENIYETDVRFPLFTGDTYYKNGISIPLRESMTIKVDPSWNFVSFGLGADQFLFPESKFEWQLRVRSNDKIVYQSPVLSEKSDPIDVSFSVSDMEELHFELAEISKFVYDSPDNWADVNYLGADLVNFVFSKNQNVDLPSGLSDKTVKNHIGMDIQTVALPSSAWVIKYLPFVGSGEKGLILAGCFNNKLYALTPGGDQLWETQLQGIPHKIDYCLSENKATIGILNWSEDTDLTLLNEHGKLVKKIE
jgi:hypothetical protein